MIRNHRCIPVRLRHWLGSLLLGLSLAANAADIAVLSAGAVRSALDEAVANFERASGHRIAIEYLPVGSLMRQLAQGATPNVVVITADVLGEAERNGWLLPGTSLPLGTVGIGVAVHESAALPDISTPDALRRTLLAARSITYIDPDKGTSGKHFAGVLQRLGIADAVKAKTVLGSAGYVVEPVARGEVELGLQQITEILPVKGVKLVGPLPEPLQKSTTYIAAPTARSNDVAAVRQFLDYLRAADVRALFVSRGFAVP